MDRSRNKGADAPPDEYARGSFTLRRMTRGQIVGLIIAILVAVIALIALQ